jgi:hypothetical protein
MSPGCQKVAFSGAFARYWPSLPFSNGAETLFLRKRTAAGIESFLSPLRDFVRMKRHIGRSLLPQLRLGASMGPVMELRGSLEITLPEDSGFPCPDSSKGNIGNTSLPCRSDISSILLIVEF